VIGIYNYNLDGVLTAIILAPVIYSVRVLFFILKPAKIILRLSLLSSILAIEISSFHSL
jgi:hypothetical protein